MHYTNNRVHSATHLLKRFEDQISLSMRMNLESLWRCNYLWHRNEDSQTISIEGISRELMNLYVATILALDFRATNVRIAMSVVPQWLVAGGTSQSPPVAEARATQ